MPIKIDPKVTPLALLPNLNRLFNLSADKIRSIEKGWNPARGTPVFTVKGKYTSRGWTEWTEGFQHGAAFLQFDATGEAEYLELGRARTIERMASHVSHTGVHDHGFNNVSTYGNLLRLIREDRTSPLPMEEDFCKLALKVSGAVQAARWTPIKGGRGYIYSFNGPHSLFIDTMRSLRSLAIAHRLGHVLMGERDQRISLLQRIIEHSQVTAEFAIYRGKGRDAYDVPGRTAHESIFNTNDGAYRCPNSQQGYSPFTTWTRGLAWAICGFAEQLEFLGSLPLSEFQGLGDRTKILESFRRSAQLTADYYIEEACACGVPVWDTGAPHLREMGEYKNHPADPFNACEPVDSSAAAIAAQGLWRLGSYLSARNKKEAARYGQAALTIAKTLLDEPYISLSPKHQGLLLHSVYHRPNGWDYTHPGQKIPNGESSMWGDYHLRELALLLLRKTTGQNYLTFFAGL
ncbi:MAG: ugl [Verrucomicrobiales bacterium]|nr:ugl [Verrucomicrobiales bacterium]